MTRRIAMVVGSLCVALVLLIGIPATLLFRDAETYHLRLGLQRDALVVADDLAALPADLWTERLDAYERSTGARVVVVDPSERLVFDTSGAPLNEPFSRPELEAALAGEIGGGVRESATLGQTLTYAAVPIRNSGEIVGALRLTMPESTVDAKVNPLQWALFWILVFVVVVALVVSWAVAKALSRPLERLAERARAIGESPTTPVGEIRGPQEVQAVAEALDETSRELSAALARSQAVAEEASHHLRTPLGALRLRVESLADSDDAEVRDQADAALVEIDRLNRRIEQILTISRGSTRSHLVLVDVPAAIAARQPHHRALTDSRGLDLHYRISEQPLSILAPLGTVERTVDELVANAADYARSEVEIVLGGDGHTVWLEVRDDGPGIPPEEQDLIFDRFVRGSEAIVGGTGLGLAMVRDAARGVGGDAFVVADPPGTTMRVEWPRRDEESDLRNSAPSSATRESTDTDERTQIAQDPSAILNLP